MASVSEQLASRINLGSIAKAEDLKKRILFTLLALIVYRIGSYIPVPGNSSSPTLIFFHSRFSNL